MGWYYTAQMRVFGILGLPSTHNSRYKQGGDLVNFTGCLPLSPVPGVSHGHTPSSLDLDPSSQGDVQNIQKISRCSGGGGETSVSLGEGVS